MKTFLSVSAALIVVPLVGFVGCTALYVNSAGEIDQRERACVSQTGLSRSECSLIVSAEIAEEFNESTERLQEASGKLRDTLGQF